MKIIGLQGNGYRKLSAFFMEFKDKGLIPIYGKNKMGKTTVLDFIKWMVNGNKELNPDVINWDSDTLSGKLRLGDYEIERENKRGKVPKLKVKNVVTGEYEKGEVQNFISTFINELTLNPKPFLDKRPLEKLKFMMELLGIDFTEINKKIEKLEQDRLLVGREIDKYGDLDKDAPAKVSKVNVDELLKQRKAIEDKNNKNREEWDKAKQGEIDEIEKFNKKQRDVHTNNKYQTDELIRLNDKRNDCLREIRELEAKIHQQTQKLNGFDDLIGKQEKVIKELPKPEPEKPLKTSLPAFIPDSTDGIDKKVSEANAVNVKAEVYEKWRLKKAEKAQKEEEYSKYDNEIKMLRDEKFAILKDTDTKVDGLEIRENGLYYKGTLADNWSDAEALRIASELCIAQIDREKQIEAIFLDRFESFDKEMRDDFNKWCEENNVQCIVTIVRDAKEAVVDDSPYFWVEEGSIELVEEK